MTALFFDKPTTESRCLMRPLAYSLLSCTKERAAFDCGSKFTNKLELLSPEVSVLSNGF